MSTVATEQLMLPEFEDLVAEDEGISPEEAGAISAAARDAFELLFVYPEVGAGREVVPLRDEYDRLTGQGWGWRKALYMAWAKLPGQARWPGTQQELAEVMGLRSARTIRRWRERNPGIDLLIAQSVVGRVSERTADILSRSFEVAMGEGYKGFNDRRMLLEIEGVYKPKQDLEITSHVNADEMAARVSRARDEAGDWEAERFGGGRDEEQDGEQDEENERG